MTLTYEEMRWLGAFPKIPNLTARRYERSCGRTAPRMLPGPATQLGACQICHAMESWSSSVISNARVLHNCALETVALISWSCWGVWGSL